MKTCFIIAPLGTEGSEIRENSNLLLELLIRPACEENGYEVLRIDSVYSTGSITQEIIKFILDSDLVIADLTNANPNVMYELGVRHSSGRPALIMAHRGENLPFDISSYRSLFYDVKNPKSAKETLKALKNTIAHIDAAESVSSPVHDVAGKSIVAKGDVFINQTELPEDSSVARTIRSISERIGSLEKTVRVIAKTVSSSSPEPQFTRDIFIVHGHDGEQKNELARLLQKLDFNPIILHEQADRGQTILQKLEYEGSKVGYAFILHTPDDEGRKKSPNEELQNRSRQNVVFEHGMFVGQFSHHRVCAIVKEGVEIPSDLSGVVYKHILAGNGIDSIAIEVVKELRAAGYVVDANKLFA